MRKIKTLAFAVLFCLSVNQVFASDINEIQYPKLYKTIASELKISTLEYAKAAYEYNALLMGDVKPEFKTLDQIDSITAYFNALDANESNVEELRLLYQADINLYKVEFANRLGLDVGKLDKFLSLFNSLSTVGVYGDITVGFPEQSVRDTDIDEFEKIEVRCNNQEECLSGSSAAPSFTILIRVGHVAGNANLPQTGPLSYNPFVVVFKDSENRPVSQSVWIYNNFSGGKKIKSLTCSRCETVKPQ